MVEVITITKFKSKNGLTYETHDLAKKADDEYAFSMGDMGATEVKNYEKEFDMYMKRLASLVETNRTSFPMF